MRYGSRLKEAPRPAPRSRSPSPQKVTWVVPKIRRGGYVFAAWRSDPPRHVHVYRNARLIVKWDLENRMPMKGEASATVLELIAELEAEGRL